MLCSHATGVVNEVLKPIFFLIDNNGVRNATISNFIAYYFFLPIYICS